MAAAVFDAAASSGFVAPSLEELLGFNPNDAAADAADASDNDGGDAAAAAAAAADGNGDTAAEDQDDSSFSAASAVIDQKQGGGEEVRPPPQLSVNDTNQNLRNPTAEAECCQQRRHRQSLMKQTDVFATAAPARALLATQQQ
jgi:hypothetical protein